MKKQKYKIRKLPSKKKDNTIYLIVVISIMFIAVLLKTTNSSEDVWVQKGDLLIKGNLTLEIGDYYDYDETSNGKNEELEDVSWKVLGLDDDGNLLLISATNVEKHVLGSKTNQEEAMSLYSSGYKLLDTIASLYGKGEHAINARSVTIEDINKITGFNAKKAREENDKLNLEVTYYWNGTSYPVYKTNTGLTGGIKLEHEKFIWFNKEKDSWNISEKSKTASLSNLEPITTEKNTWYSYNNGDNDNQLLKPNSKKYNMIFNSSDDTQEEYWLASSYTTINDDYMAFGYYKVIKDSISYVDLVYSNGQSFEKELGVRVVVTLDI